MTVRTGRPWSSRSPPAPVDGQATEAVRRAVADALGLRGRAVSLETGASSRDKLFTVGACRPVRPATRPSTTCSLLRAGPGR